MWCGLDDVAYLIHGVTTRLHLVNAPSYAPTAAILPGQAIGRHGYQVRDHFTAALGGMNLDGSPLPARQASPTASMRSTRPAAPIPVEPPMSRSHVIDGGPTPVTSFYYGDGSTHRYGHNSSRPSTTGYAPEAQAASSSRGAGATPTRYRRYTVDVEQSPEMVRMKHRQQEDFQHYLSQAEHDRAEQQRRRQEEKVRDRDLQHHFVLDPKTAGVAKTNGRIQYSISEPKNFREKTLDPRHLENNPRPKHFVEEVEERGGAVQDVRFHSDPPYLMYCTGQGADTGKLPVPQGFE